MARKILSKEQRALRVLLKETGQKMEIERNYICIRLSKLQKLKEQISEIRFKLVCIDLCEYEKRIALEIILKDVCAELKQVKADIKKAGAEQTERKKWHRVYNRAYQNTLK